MFLAFQRRFYMTYKASGFARTFKRRRYQHIVRALGIKAPASILEIGCGTGADFIQFAADDGFRCSGLDLVDQDHMRPIRFTQGHAHELPYEDGAFDVAVSIGLFEHVQPIEDLCRAASEIARVARSYCVIVPALGTLLEPHLMSPFWGMRDHHRKRAPHGPINYFSDEAWLQFNGFAGASTERFWYAPGLQNLAIYRTK